MSGLSRGFTTAALAVAVLTASAYAGNRLKLAGLFDAPGIDDFGNIDFGDTGTAYGKLVVNTRNGKIRATARGRVPNDSGRRASFKTRDVNLFLGVVGAYLGVDVGDLDVADLPGRNRFKRASYKVSKRGRLKAKAKVRLSRQTLGLLGGLLNGDADLDDFT